MKQKIEIEVEIPEGYEATGEFRTPENGEYFSAVNSRIVNQQDGDYLSEYVILRKVEPPQPEYKSFEIDWHRYPYLTDKEAFMAEARVGLKIDNYRIFGFGDDKQYVGRNYYSPCDSNGNYKYAYGRLEV